MKLKFAVISLSFLLATSAAWAKVENQSPESQNTLLNPPDQKIIEPTEAQSKKAAMINEYVEFGGAIEIEYLYGKDFFLCK